MLKSSSDPAFDRGLPNAQRNTSRHLAGRVAAFLNPVPVVCFSGALITDIIYSRTAEMQWANSSAWLLLFGIFCGALAAIAACVEVIRHRIGGRAEVQARIVGGGGVLTFALLNNFVHSRDAWTSVVPTGITLSALTVLAMIATAAFSAAIAQRRTPTGAR